MRTYTYRANIFNFARPPSFAADRESHLDTERLPVVVRCRLTKAEQFTFSLRDTEGSRQAIHGTWKGAATLPGWKQGR